MSEVREVVREEVRKRYAEAAISVTEGTKDAAAFDGAMFEGASCCDPGSSGGGCCGGGAEVFGATLYSNLDTSEVPDAAMLASLGCGNPIAVADLNEGETVLDLGSGGGIDVLLSAKRVGSTGKAYGLDMTDEMLALANENKAAAGAANVEFLKGFIEDVPLPDSSVDVIISNCVINLSSDKQAVFDEMARVLRSGGRVGVTDVVSSNELSEAERAERGSYVGCIAGALSFDEYRGGLEAAGFADVDISPTHSVADGMFSAIVKATKG
jgi:SAM-dependent methyltransferase